MQQEERQIEQLSQEEQEELTLFQALETAAEKAIIEYADSLKEKEMEEGKRVLAEAKKAEFWVPKAISTYLEMEEIPLDKMEKLDIPAIVLTIRGKDLVLEKGVKEQVIYTAENSKYLEKALVLLSEFSKMQGNKNKVLFEAEEGRGAVTIRYKS